MGKKPTGKAKAKATAQAQVQPQPEVEDSAEKLEARRIWQQRRDAQKWATAQLGEARRQLAAAQSRGACDWLQAAHEFHEIQLIKLGKRLEDKSLDDVPQELRDQLAKYFEQGAKNPAIEQEAFCEDRMLWELLPGDRENAYVRAAASQDDSAAVARIQAWSDASTGGVEAFCELMRAHAASPDVQEAGLTRIGGLLGDLVRGETGGDSRAGLTSATLMPAIGAAMREHPADPGVQRSGCAALRGLAMAPGQLASLCDAGGVQLAVDAVKTHYKSKDVAMAGNGAFWAMAQEAGKNSPELGTMRECCVVEVLKKVMEHHAWDASLCGKLRVTLPFITED